MVDDPDRNLLERFAQGDGAALETLFRRYEAETLRWILRIVRDAGAAEDVLVESFWRAYRARARFDPAQSFGAWMRRISTNAALDRLREERRRTKRHRVLGGTSAPVEPDPDLREAIEEAFRRLPATLRAVAALALVEERPLAEIADALSLPCGTVKSRLARAGARLRKELARMGIRP